MRRTKLLTIEAEGRDKGKQFLLTEMFAAPAERWATRLIFALQRGQLDGLPPGVEAGGMAAVALIGLQAIQGANYFEIQPLLDEMWDCVKVVPDPSKPDFTRALVIDADIEEVATIVEIRKEVFGLHVDFTKVAAFLSSLTATTGGTTPGIQTSEA